MGDTGIERDPLEALAADFLERRRRGESISVSEFAARYPRQAEEIEDLFPTILAMEDLKTQKEHSNGPVPHGPLKLERLGDFRIIREIGRGGMGIVYEAEQESLGRRVAMKVLPTQSLLDPKHLERFQREARIAARLHHTNIVPVFGVGEQDGYHYYVMQYINGVGLDAVVARLAEIDRRAQSEDDADMIYLTDGDRADAKEIEGVARHLLCGHRPMPRTSSSSIDERRSGDVVEGREASEGEASAPIDAVPAGGHAAAEAGVTVGQEYWQGVARIGLHVADALHYAHTQGTLHRDIKPANVLVDAEGGVWVTDFGLAKALQTESLTHPGDVMGTLRYMAPEQFSGETDARSDIYSLGLTLYELLTWRPAYQDTDRTALIRQVTQNEPRRPRRLNPHVPHDLETIVLKAVARDSNDRYDSAAVLAEDLQCFLEDRPIHARRVTSVERLWRWCRRNPAVATLAGTTLLLIVLVAAVASFGYVQTKRALTGEENQRAKAEANAELAAAAIDRIFDRFSPRRMMAVSRLTVQDAEDANTKIEVPASPVLSKESVTLLEDMLAFYDRLAKQVGDESRLNEKAAEACRRVGDIRQRLGQYDQAIAAYRRAIGMYEDLSQAGPGDRRFQTEIARIHNDLGQLHRLMRQNEETRQAHRQALDILRTAEARSGHPDARYELARTHYFLGMRARVKPRTPTHVQRGKGKRQTQRARPDSASGSRSVARTPTGNGRHGRGSQLDRAVALLEELTAEDPSNPNYRHMLALCHRERFQQLQSQQPSAAAQALKRATSILEQLVKDVPDIPDYRHDLCETYAAFDVQGKTLPGFGYLVVYQRLRKALGLAGRLVAEHPSIPRYVASQAHVYHKLALLLERSRKAKQGEHHRRRSVELQQSLVDQFPDDPYHKVWLAVFQVRLADLCARSKKLDEAQSLLEQTIDMLNDMEEHESDIWFLHALQQQCYRSLADVLRRQGKRDLAGEVMSKAKELRKRPRKARSGSSKNPDGPPAADVEEE